MCEEARHRAKYEIIFSLITLISYVQLCVRRRLLDLVMDHQYFIFTGGPETMVIYERIIQNRCVQEAG